MLKSKKTHTARKMTKKTKTHSWGSKKGLKKTAKCRCSWK